MLQKQGGTPDSKPSIGRKWSSHQEGVSKKKKKAVSPRKGLVLLIDIIWYTLRSGLTQPRCCSDLLGALSRCRIQLSDTKAVNSH